MATSATGKGGATMMSKVHDRVDLEGPRLRALQYQRRGSNGGYKCCLKIRANLTIPGQRTGFCSCLRRTGAKEIAA